MYLKCSTERSAANQRVLERHLLKFMLQIPFEQISISALCQDAGISRKTFYRLFESKADVLLALMDHTLLDYESFRPDPSVSPGEIHRFLAFWQEHKPLLDALHLNHASSIVTDRALLHIINENPDMVQMFCDAEAKYPQEMMRFYISGLFSLVLEWHHSGYQRSIDEMSEIIGILLRKSPVASW